MQCCVNSASFDWLVGRTSISSNRVVSEAGESHSLEPFGLACCVKARTACRSSSGETWNAKISCSRGPRASWQGPMTSNRCSQASSRGFTSHLAGCALVSACRPFRSAFRCRAASIALFVQSHCSILVHVLDRRQRTAMLDMSAGLSTCQVNAVQMPQLTIDWVGFFHCGHLSSAHICIAVFFGWHAG